MDLIVQLASDPFVAVAICLALLAYHTWVHRHDPKKPKTRMPTVEEATTLGIPLNMRSFYTVEEPPKQPTSKPIVPAPASAVAAPAVNALPVALVPRMKLSAIADAPGAVSYLVAGPKGSGKTTVLRTLLVRRASLIDECVALDPHNSPGKWPCAVIGGGLNWTALDSALRTMSIEMQHRFVQLDRGEIREGQFPLRVYVGDEFLSISQELDGKGSKIHAGKAIIERLVNGRKVGDALMVASQNDTVEALGIQGNADIKGCFDYITFLGALVSTRAKFHGCPPAVIDAATKQERVGVVWFTERNQWYVLDFDLRPMLEGEEVEGLFSSFAPLVAAGTDVLVSQNVPVYAGTTPYTAYTASDTSTSTTPVVSDEEIRNLYTVAGLSKNKIAERLTGTKQSRLFRIAAALNEDVDEEHPQRAMTA